VASQLSAVEAGTGEAATLTTARGRMARTCLALARAVRQRIRTTAKVMLTRTTTTTGTDTATATTVESSVESLVEAPTAWQMASERQSNVEAQME